MERIDKIAEVVNAHSKTIKQLADQVNKLTKENASLTHRVGELEKSVKAIASADRLKGHDRRNGLFKDMFG